MPEYLAPGVYVEETSFRAKSIEGVSTSTCGFVGPCRFGPIRGEPELLTSFADFERIYGGLDQLNYGSSVHNYLAHGVRAFFEEGGKRLYVSRVYKGTGGESTFVHMGGSPSTNLLTLTARYPGVAGDFRVTFTIVAGANVLQVDPVSTKPIMRGIKPNDTLLVMDINASPDKSQGLYDVALVGDTYTFTEEGGDTFTWDTVAGTFMEKKGGGSPAAANPTHFEFRPVTVTVTLERPIARPKRPTVRYGSPEVFEGFSLHPSHPNSLNNYFTASPAGRMADLTVPFKLTSALTTGATLASEIFGSAVLTNLATTTSSAQERSKTYLLKSGSDGTLPGATDYQGTEDASTRLKSGLMAFEDIEDISIVATPGSSAGYTGNASRAQAIQGYLISHCEKMRYRIGVLDCGDKFAVSEVRTQRGLIDSTHGALYYPWVRVFDPVTEEELNLPPSGFVSGIYARNDIENGVHKAPANEVVRLAIGFETLLNKSQQDVLNPDGINCFRFFEGRGHRLWGARTVSSDSEWKYVNLRRYFAFLERSIEKGTQWVVFENNNEQLWYNVRRTIEDFLYNEWKSNHLMGTRPEQAFFVRCDRSTMTQNDLDNGRLICLVGVSPVRPAEFVIFRIGQWTADSN